VKKTELAPKAKKHRSIEEIMRDPSAKAKLTNLVDEAVMCKQKIMHEQQNIKALRDAALEDLGLKPQLFSNYVAMVFNNDYQTRKDGLEQQLTLVELVMGDAQLGNDAE
jgi:hypothetical protein